jgi:hypothetical protein
MPRPTSKEELFLWSNAGFKNLLAFVESLPEEKQNTEFPVIYLNRDALAQRTGAK